MYVACMALIIQVTGRQVVIQLQAEKVFARGC
jgi:hypothetical protein